MITALDTSVLLDILVNDPKHADRSEALLFQAYKQGPLIISPAVYAELVPQARNRDELDGWLQQVRIQVVPFTVDVIAGSTASTFQASRFCLPEISHFTEKKLGVTIDVV